jgi:serine/threonine protein kinase
MPFDSSLDIWSAGCVLAEMALGDPLFPGVDETDQLARFVEVLGLPPDTMRERIEGEMGRRRHRKQLKRRIEDQQLVDLIGKCLVWDPAVRITAEDALKHPFFDPKL